MSLNEIKRKMSQFTEKLDVSQRHECPRREYQGGSQMFHPFFNSLSNRLSDCKLAKNHSTGMNFKVDL